MIKLEHVYKTYPGPVHALSNVSVEIEKGEFVYLSGPSGAGKTTLFRLITCYDQVTSGSVSVVGFDLSRAKTADLPLIRRKIGVVFQDFRLLKSNTVFENVALPLEILGVKKSEIEYRVKDVLEQLGLRYKESAWPEHLSGGEQQRVAIARAIIAKPGLLIADEPTGNLDTQKSQEIMDLFKKINAQGTTVVVATHNEAFLNDGKHRILKLNSGKLIDGDARTILSSPEPFKTQVMLQ